jgi:hypothetical protein
MVAGAGVAVLVVAAVLIAVLTGGGASPTPVPPTLARTGLESIFEAEGALHADPAATLNALRRLGANRVRVYVGWNTIAPDPTSSTRPAFDAADPAAYPAANWTVLDTIIRDLAARGMGIDFTIGAPPPLWARGRGDPGHPVHPQWRPSAHEFELFMRALGMRYSGHYRPAGVTAVLPHVGFWSIWNEPNFGPDLVPQTLHHSALEVSPMLYRHLLDAAWTALRATGHARDTIVFGETAPAGQSIPGPGEFGNLVPLRFLRALYCVGATYQPLRGAAAAERGCPTDASGSATFRTANPALFEASAFADHPYSQGLPPNQPTPQEPDYAELADIPKLERALDTLQRVYGSHKRFPIYSTEFGYQTKPPDPEPGTVSPTTAAAYMNWAEYLSWRDPRMRSYDQYLLTDPASNNFASGLESLSGAPKPGYYAYRMPIYLPVVSTAAGHPLEVWGLARPSFFARRQTGRVQHVAIQFRTSGAFRTLRTVALTDRYGYLDVHETFPGTGVVRLAWAYPHGPTIFSRQVAITLH